MANALPPNIPENCHPFDDEHVAYFLPTVVQWLCPDERAEQPDGQQQKRFYVIVDKLTSAVNNDQLSKNDILVLVKLIKSKRVMIYGAQTGWVPHLKIIGEVYHKAVKKPANVDHHNILANLCMDVPFMDDGLTAVRRTRVMKRMEDHPYDDPIDAWVFPPPIPLRSDGRSGRMQMNIFGGPITGSNTATKMNMA
eukprot:464801_1